MKTLEEKLEENRAEIVRALDALGYTSTAVEDSLVALGIKGKVGDCETCVLTNYLFKTTGMSVLTTKNGIVFDEGVDQLWTTNYTKEEFLIPFNEDIRKHFIEFIYDFDSECADERLYVKEISEEV